MRMVQPLIEELDREAKATRRLLERVPEKKLDWKPHSKSMSLGQLALHIASIPGNVAELSTLEVMEVPDSRNYPSPASTEECLKVLEEGVRKAKSILADLDDETALGTWRMARGSSELMAVPRIGFVRTVLLNHWYHHRGQMCVYLRLLDVPVPAIYGPSADENPFAG